LDLIPSINRALAVEAAMQRARHKATLGDMVSAWLQPVMMRYAVSSLASIIIFTCVFAALRPHMIALHEAAVAFDQSAITIVTVDPFHPLYDINKPISPQSYAALRN